MEGCPKGNRRRLPQAHQRGLCLTQQGAVARRIALRPIAGQIRRAAKPDIFRVQPGFDLVVDYGAGNQVCKLQVPALMPADAAKVQNSDDMKQKMHAFFAELVPDSMRGKELRRLMSQTGAFSGVGFDEYEHVTFVETHSGSET